MNKGRSAGEMGTKHYGAEYHTTHLVAVASVGISTSSSAPAAVPIPALCPRTSNVRG